MYRPRARRRLTYTSRPAAASRIQAAVRGFLARRRMKNRKRLLSPYDVKKLNRKPVGNRLVSKGRYPAARVGNNMGSIKKGKKVKPRSPGTIVAHFDQNLYTQQKQVAYIGFWTAGTYDQIGLAYAGAVMRQIFARSGAPPVTWQGSYRPMQNQTAGTIQQGPQEIQFLFSKEHALAVQSTGGVVTGTDYHTYVMTVNQTQSFEQYAEALRDQIRGRFDDGYLPCMWEAYIKTPDDTARRMICSNKHWGEEMVDLGARSTIKIQNVTPASNIIGDRAAATYQAEMFNVNDIAANPLQGKVYDFKNDTPRLASGFKENMELTTSTFREIGEIETKKHDSRFMLTNKLRSNEAWDGDLLGCMSQPFNGTSVFRNIDTIGQITMPPGGFKSIVRTAKVHTNTRRFVTSLMARAMGSSSITFAPHQPSKSHFNKAVMVGLEPALRTANGSQEFVCLAANQDVRLRISLKSAPTKALPQLAKVEARWQQHA